MAWENCQACEVRVEVGFHVKGFREVPEVSVSPNSLKGEHITKYRNQRRGRKFIGRLRRGDGELADILQFAYYFLSLRPANRSARIGLLQHLVTRPADHAEKTKLEEPERSSDQSALAVIPVCASVSDSVRDPRHNPSHAHDRRRHRVSESCDQQRSDEHAVVLEEVAVGPLRAVEQIHLLLLLGSGSAHVAVLGVLLGVGDAGGFAEGSNAASVPEADLSRIC